MPSYIIHSQGPWKKHKYIKKVGNKYYYSNDNRDGKLSKDDEEANEKDIIDGLKKGHYGGTKDEQLKSLGSSYSVLRTKANKSINEYEKAKSEKAAKEEDAKSSTNTGNIQSEEPKKGGSKKSSSKNTKKEATPKVAKEKAAKSSGGKSSSGGSSKGAKEEKEKTTEKKKPQLNLNQMIKKSISSVAKIGNNDSISASATDDGKWNVTVKYANGKTQSFVLNSAFKLIKHEKEKDDIKHSGVIMWTPNHEDYLEHHGILGMKWGVRRYQNEDGTLTKAGKRRYGRVESAIQNEKNLRKEYREIDDERHKYLKSHAPVSSRTFNRATSDQYKKMSWELSANDEEYHRLAVRQDEIDALITKASEKTYKEIRKMERAYGRQAEKIISELEKERK